MVDFLIRLYYTYFILNLMEKWCNNMKKKKISMKDIAEALDVSINTVSLALNNKPGISTETRQSIIQKAKELGYSVSAQTRPLRSIALLLDKRYIKNLSFYSRVVYGITTYASQNSYNVIVDFFSNEMPSLPQAVLNNSVEGILTAGTISDDFLSLLLGTRLPFVLIDFTSYHTAADSVGTQNLNGGYAAAEYMIQQGHQTIGFVGDIHYSNNLRERWLGFSSCIADYSRQAICQEHGKYSILSDIAPSVIQKDYSRLVAEIQALPQLPQGWVCCNDETAVCLYQALGALGIHPGKDISVMGFDDVENSTLVQPALTTMHVPKKQMGETAIARLCARIESPDLPVQNITLPVWLVERNSVIKMK